MEELNKKNLLRIWLFIISLPLFCFGLLTFLVFIGLSAPNPLREAEVYLKVINRTQHAYFLEKNSFAESLDKLDAIIFPKFKNYHFKLKVTDKSVFTYTIANSVETRTKFWFKIIPIRSEPLPNYVGAIFAIPNQKNDENELLIATISCRSLSLEKTEIAPPYWRNNKLVCAPGTEEF